ALQQTPVALPSGFPSAQGLQFALILGAITLFVFLMEGRLSPGVYGFRGPSGTDWLSLLPLAGISALAGGIWIPAARLPTDALSFPGWPEVCALVMLPLASEVAFRGLIHGGLARTFP